MRIRCVDFETTGFPPDAAVVESGWCDLEPGANGIAWQIRIPTSQVCNPGRPIPPEASAVHHLTNEDVFGAPPWKEIVEASGNGVDLLAAHRADFEAAFLPTWPKDKWICTWKVALRLWPEAPSHKLQVLRYWAGLKVVKELAEPPHRAAGDAYVTARLLKVLLANVTVEQALTISAEPALLPRLTFGKHTMKPMAEVPADYLEWMLGQKDMDKDARHTAMHELSRRRT